MKAGSEGQKLVFEVESQRIIDLFYRDEPMTAYDILEKLSTLNLKELL